MRQVWSDRFRLGTLQLRTFAHLYMYDLVRACFFLSWFQAHQTELKQTRLASLEQILVLRNNLSRQQGPTTECEAERIEQLLIELQWQVPTQPGRRSVCAATALMGLATPLHGERDHRSAAAVRYLFACIGMNESTCTALAKRSMTRQFVHM